MRLGTDKELRKLKVLEFMCKEITKRERAKHVGVGCGEFKFSHFNEINFSFSNHVYISCEVDIYSYVSFNGGCPAFYGANTPSLNKIWDDYILYDGFGGVVSLIRALYKRGFSALCFGKKRLTLDVVDYTSFKVG